MSYYRYIMFMLRITLLASLLLPAAPALAFSPIAEIICAPKDQMTRKLAGQFGESRRATGLRGPEQMVEIWADEVGGWTMVITYASGKACIVAMGEHWTLMDLPGPA